MTTSPRTNPEDPEVLERGERFEQIDGRYQYSYTSIVYQQGADKYHARSKCRFSSVEVDISQLTQRELIPAAAYRPKFLSTWTQAPDPLPADCFTKRPKLSSYQASNPYQISERVREEVQIYERLKEHPHPNIVQYHGCQLDRNGLVMGICLAKHDLSLLRRVNPRYFGRRAFKYDDQLLPSRDDCLKGIRQGLEHLHSLGVVHNDINPANIMLDEHGTAVIIDFDSCRPIGHSLEMVGRTYPWYDEGVQISQPSNDLDALDELAEWMTSKDIKRFKFPE